MHTHHNTLTHTETHRCIGTHADIHIHVHSHMHTHLYTQVHINMYTMIIGIQSHVLTYEHMCPDTIYEHMNKHT